MLKQFGQHGVELVVLDHADLELLAASAVAAEGLRVGEGPLLVLVHLAGDVVDVGGLLRDVLLDLLERAGLAVLPLEERTALRLRQVELHPRDLVVQDARVLHQVERFVQPATDLHDPLGVSHQHQPLELLHLAALVLVLEPREEGGFLIELLEEQLVLVVVLVVSFEVGIHDFAHELDGVLQHVLLVEMGGRGGVDELVGEAFKVDEQAGKGFRDSELVLVDDEHVLVGGGEVREVLLVDADDEGHEVFVGGVDEVEGQVVDEHVLPLQRLDQLQQAFNDHHVEVLALAGYDHLLLQQHAQQDCLDHVGGERDVEEVAELEERGRVELVEVQDRPVAALLEQNHLPVLVLVELPQIVLHD